MRLVDADALSQKIEDKIQTYDNEHAIGKVSFEYCKMLIDNATTVELPVARWDCYCEGQKVGYEKALSERPQGKWIKDETRPNECQCQCNNCGNYDVSYFPFCHWCGADMRKGGA